VSFFSFPRRKQPYLISPCPFIHVVVGSGVWGWGVGMAGLYISLFMRLIESGIDVSMEGVFFN
jgi:hypothetical protein